MVLYVSLLAVHQLDCYLERLRVHIGHTTCIPAKRAVWQMHPPDVVVAELGILGPVEQHRPRRGVYGIRLGSGPGHLIICLAVTGGGASRSCTVGLMGERRG